MPPLIIPYGLMVRGCSSYYCEQSPRPPRAVVTVIPARSRLEPGCHLSLRHPSSSAFDRDTDTNTNVDERGPDDRLWQGPFWPKANSAETIPTLFRGLDPSRHHHDPIEGVDRNRGLRVNSPAWHGSHRSGKKKGPENRGPFVTPYVIAAETGPLAMGRRRRRTDASCAPPVCRSMHNSTRNSSSFFFLPSSIATAPSSFKKAPKVVQKKKKKTMKKPRERAYKALLALCRDGGPRTAKFPASSVHHPPPNNGAILPPLGLDSSMAPCGLDPTRPLPRRAAGLQKLPLGWSHCFPLESRFISFPLPPPRTRGWANSFWSETLGALNSDKTPCDEHDISLK